MKNFGLKHKKRGFTLIEVLCCLIIISIVSSIALPSINNFRSSERCKAEASLLVAYIRQAKYDALQEGCTNRIVFDPNDHQFFKVQTYRPVSNPDNRVFNGSDIPDYEDVNWESIGDSEEIEINSVVEMELGPMFKNRPVLYFQPDGYIHDHQQNLLPQETILFTYGTSQMQVEINALGVLESIVFSLEEDEDAFSDGDYTGETPTGDTDD